jgi:hypothetical protein
VSSPPPHHTFEELPVITARDDEHGVHAPVPQHAD